MNLEHQAESNAQETKQAAEAHKVGLAQTKETGKVKTQVMKEQAKAKPKPSGGK
jgi:hypothetical protein